MTEQPSPGDPSTRPAAGPPDDRRAEPPVPASDWVEDHAPPSSEAERQAQETIRSVSRLEESN